MWLKIWWSDTVPRQDFNELFVQKLVEKFIQYMANRMGFSHFKYGLVDNAYPYKVDSLGTAEDRISLYRQTGNTEFLVDAANQLMTEFMRPSISGAEFRPNEKSRMNLKEYK